MWLFICRLVRTSGFMFTGACMCKRRAHPQHSASVRLSVFLFISFPIVYQGKRSEERLLAQSLGIGDIRSSEPARATHAC